MTRAGLARNERIRKRVEFKQVYDRGLRVHGRYATIFLLSNGLSVGRLGIAATRKLGGAVERNRAKRLIREVFRHNKLAPGFDVVVVPKRELLEFNNHLLNYANEAGLGELATAGLSPDYVFRETQRARAGVKGACKVLPGIDIGIPTGKNSRKASPDDTYAATAAALRAGADGVIFSRKYSEMQLANLSAGGRAVKEFLR